MKAHESTRNRKTLGALHKAEKTKERSPVLIGQLKLQRHTFDAIAEEFNHGDAGEIACNIAGWENVDKHGENYLTIELSPPFTAKRRPKACMFGWLADDEDE